MVLGSIQICTSLVMQSSICHTIVEAHGGKIWYETAPGGGAAFHFTVPLAEIDDDVG